MRCGTMLGKTLSIHRSPVGERYGATVAENGLVEASLESSDDIRWDFISSDLQNEFSDVSRVDTKEGFADLWSLEQRYGSRVKLVDPTFYTALPQNDEFIYVTSTPAFHHFAALRRQCSAEHIPICTLVHSLNTRSYYQVYAHLLTQVYSHDCIVASSSSARHVLDETFAEIADDLSRRFKVSHDQIPKPTIVNLPFGVQVPSEELLSRELARQQLQIPENAFVMLYLGRVSDNYKADVNVLLQALLMLTSSARPSHLVVAGQVEDAIYLKRLKAQAASWHLQKSITFVENFPDFTKSAVITSCDVVVMPADSIQETFGLAILEAMAHSRPVVASSWSGYRDLVVLGETGFLFGTAVSEKRFKEVNSVWPITDVRRLATYLSRATILNLGEMLHFLQLLRDDSELAVSMGQKARARVDAHYSWSSVVKRYSSLWQEQIHAGSQMRTHPQRQPVNFDSRFLHFADRALTDSSIITLDKKRYDTLLLAGMTPQVSSTLMRLPKANLSFRVDELLNHGLRLDDVLLLLKHGIYNFS